jgi:hypothetical protein
MRNDNSIARKRIATFLLIIGVVAVALAVLSGLFESLFVIGERSPSVTYLGFPVAWSGLPSGIYEYSINGLMKYVVSVIGFIIDVACFMGLIIIFIISLTYLNAKREVK